MSTPNVPDESIDRGVDPELQQTVDIAVDALGEVLGSLDLDVDLSVESAMERRGKPREMPEGGFVIGAFRRMAWRDTYRYYALDDVATLTEQHNASRHAAAEITYETAILSEFLGDHETADRLFSVAAFIDPDDGNWQYRQSALRHASGQEVDGELYRPPLDLHEDFESPEDRLRFYVDLYGLTGIPRRMDEIVHLVRAEPHTKKEVFTYMQRHGHTSVREVKRLIEAPTDGIFEEILIWAQLQRDGDYDDDQLSALSEAVINESDVLTQRIKQDRNAFSQDARALLASEVIIAREIVSRENRSRFRSPRDALGRLGIAIGGEKVRTRHGQYLDEEEFAKMADQQHLALLRKQRHLRLGTTEQVAAVHVSEPAQSPLNGEIFDAHLRLGDVDMAQARMNNMKPLERVHAAIRMKHDLGGYAELNIDEVLRPFELEMQIDQITRAADGVLTETLFEAHLAEAERELAGFMPDMNAQDWEFQLQQIESMEDLKAALDAIAELENKALQDDLLEQLRSRFQIAA